jgi:hypothetical protein
VARRGRSPAARGTAEAAPMRSGSAPAWARELVLVACSEAGVAPPSVLRWRRLARDLASGVTNRRRGSIAVSAGTDAADARHTLLHELAHWLAPDEYPLRRRGRRRAVVHHGVAFYRVAVHLYARHEPPLENALRREAWRYPSSLRHAAALGVEVAQLAGERRARVGARAGVRGAWRVMVPEHAVELRRHGRWYVCATCGRRLVGRTLVRAARRGLRERHTCVLYTTPSPRDS